MNGAPLVFGLTAALAAAGALSRRGSQNTPSGLQVSVLPRTAFRKAFRDEDGHVNVIQVSGLRGHGLMMLDVQDILNDRIEESGDEEAELDRLHRELVAAARFFDGLSFPLTVYRGVLLSGPAKSALRRQEIGSHWTPNREIALRFARGQHDASESSRRATDVPTLLTGQISSPLQVNWRTTFAFYLGYGLPGVDPQEQIHSDKVSLLKTQEV